jgi:hypothetical protein
MHRGWFSVDVVSIGFRADPSSHEAISEPWTGTCVPAVDAVGADCDDRL